MNVKPSTLRKVAKRAKKYRDYAKRPELTKAEKEYLRKNFGTNRTDNSLDENRRGELERTLPPAVEVKSPEIKLNVTPSDVKDNSAGEPVPAPEQKPNFLPTATFDDCHRAFSAAVGKPVDTNSYVAEFLWIMKRVRDMSRGSFTFADVLRHNQAVGLDVQVHLRPLFERYVDALSALNKLEIVEGAYGPQEPVYIILN